MVETPFVPSAAETIPGCIAWWAGATPDAPALLGIAGERFSYRELQDYLECFGRDLAALGVGRDDAIVLAVPEGAAAAAVLLATMRAAVAVPVNSAQSPAETEEMLTAIAPRAVIAGGLANEFRQAARRVGIPVLEVDARGTLPPGQHPVGPAVAPRAEPGGDDLALILLTSGTTERPRRVPVAHGPLLEVCAARVMIRSLTARDRALNTAPSSFVVGSARTAEAVISGGSAIVATPAETVGRAAAIRDLEPTWTWMSPALLESVLETAAREPAIQQWPLRMIRTGGARVAPDLVARAEALWGAPVLNGYGTTETLGFIAAEEHPERIPRKPGSAGQIRPGLEVTIRGASGEALPPGERGEITVQSGRMFAGYLDDPEATADVFFPGGWYRSGDLGYLDDEGYLFVTGRAREMINRGGEKIAPHEIDDVLREHPAIADAASFALPVPRLGEEVAAAVVLRAGRSLTKRALRRWMAHRLSPAKIPRKIWFVDALPRTGSSKVQRGVLAERFGDRGRE